MGSVDLIIDVNGRVGGRFKTYQISKYIEFYNFYIVLFIVSLNCYHMFISEVLGQAASFFAFRIDNFPFSSGRNNCY